jgi:hypothetical protein
LQSIDKYLEKDYNDLFSTVKNNITNIEPDLIINDDLIDDIVTLAFSDTNLRHREINKMSKQNNYQLPIDIGLNSVGNIGHAVSLLINKNNGKIEYIFMDPLNASFKGNKNYKYTILSIVRFIDNISDLKKCIIRFRYFNTLDLIRNNLTENQNEQKELINLSECN